MRGTPAALRARRSTQDSTRHSITQEAELTLAIGLCSRPGVKSGLGAGQIVSMKAKSTSLCGAWEEGKVSEIPCENPHETSKNWLGLTQSATCNDECLLKACASRQEKPSFCHKNGAARHAHIGDSSRLPLCRPVLDARGRMKFARPADLHTLAEAMHSPGATALR